MVIIFYGSSEYDTQVCSMENIFLQPVFSGMFEMFEP